MISNAYALDPSQLAALLAVVEDGSFERAAARLHVTPSAISQRIKQLEIQVGHVVVRRASPCLATQAGQVLLRYAKQAELLAREAVDELHGSVSTASAVAIAVNADSLETWFLDAVAPLANERRLTFELLVDDQEHTAEMLRAGRVLAAVTAEPTPVQGCRVTTLGAMHYTAVASPAYLAAHFPRGVGRAAMERAPVLTFNRKDTLQAQLLQKMAGATLSPPTHWIPSSRGFVDAALAAVGWGTVPTVMAAPLLASGELVRLRRDATLEVPLYWQHWRLETPLMEQLTQSVVGAARTMNG